MESATTYNYEESLSSSIAYFDGDELAASTFLNKYALKDEKQQLLEKTPADMHHRLARELSRVEHGKFSNPLGEDEIFALLDGFKKIVPQGSPMYGIGNRYQYISLSNCYVVDPPLDSYGGICKTDQQLVQISKRRGGNGTDVSLLRPRATATHNAARTSTGIGPFMERFSNSIREVGQEGRRGALMLTISVHHPEIETFATIKNDDKKVTGANISIRLTDEFLNAVEKDEEYELRWPCTPEDAETLNVPFRKVNRKVRARDIWKKIINSAWSRAEPGLLFWDNILRESIPDCYAKQGFRTVSTNPCSEIPLSVLDSCRLLLLNLMGYVQNPFTPNAKFDFANFYKDAQIAQRLMDDIVDLELECIDRILSKIDEDPEPADTKKLELDLWHGIQKACVNGRRTGTGITALGDALAALGVKYGSDESIEVTEKIYRVLKFGAYRSSVDMAKDLSPFPIWNNDLEKDNPFLKRIESESIDLGDETVTGESLMNDMQQYGRRNIALLTTAPAGTVSMLTRTSSGIEPVFMLGYVRRRKINANDATAKVDFVDNLGDKWTEFTVYHPTVSQWMKVTGETDVAKSPWYGCCAEDLDWKQRVILQAKANSHVDHAISSTINLPESVAEERVAEIYETAWKYGCKGITVYRNNCRTGVLVQKKEKEVKTDGISKTDAPRRPKSLPCDVHHVKVKGQEYFVLVGLFGENEPYEVFAGKNGQIAKSVKNGTLEKMARGRYQATFDDKNVFENVSDHCDDMEEAICRLTSTSLRHGADIAFIVHQLEKIPGGDMHAFYKAMSRTLKKYIKEGQKVTGENCGECGASSLIRAEGCVRCASCGWTKCS
jgi:ribonucleoside-diphosphate reductase alpha chain